MIDIYKKYQCSIIAIEEISFNDIEKYGVIFGDLIDGTDDTYRVNKMLEKPDFKDLNELAKDEVDMKNKPNFMGIIGRYILTPDIFEILKNIKPDKGGEIQITDALLVQAKQGKVIAYKYRGKRFDCGSVDGFVKAINHYAKQQGIT